MARASVALLCIVAASAVLVASAGVIDHGTSFTPTPEWFAQWMSRGGETWTGDESVPDMRQKFIRRVLGWAIDEITDDKHDVRALLSPRAARVPWELPAWQAWTRCVCGFCFAALSHNTTAAGGACSGRL